MRKTASSLTVFLVVVVVAVASVAAYGIHRFRDHYLSPELKRTLTAAMDTSATENDISAYLRDARLQVRTRKDAEILQEFETAVWYSGKTSVPQYDLDKLLDDESSASYDHLHYLKAVTACIRIRCSDSSTLHTEVENYREDENRDSNQLKLDKKYVDDDTKRAENARITSLKLFQEVRADMGLPPMSR